VGGKSSADTSKQGVLIEKRNERAMDVLHESLQMSDQEKDVDISTNNREQKRIALLYGAGHCRDLHRRFIQEENMAPIRSNGEQHFVPRRHDGVILSTSTIRRQRRMILRRVYHTRWGMEMTLSSLQAHRR